MSSPKQLVVLFSLINWDFLENTLKTKTGYSTAVDVLERLAPILLRLLRKSWFLVNAKIQSTYVICLQDWILADGKIHTRYMQDLTPRPGVCLVWIQTCKIFLRYWNKGA